MQKPAALLVSWVWGVLTTWRQDISGDCLSHSSKKGHSDPLGAIGTHESAAHSFLWSSSVRVQPIRGKIPEK